MTEEDTFNALKYRRVAGADHPIFDAGTVYWVNDQEQLHRIGSPTAEFPNGTKQWWINGKLHRENGPAIEWASGDKSWYINGVLLSEDKFNARITK
jgi:hypothetical protein